MLPVSMWVIKMSSITLTSAVFVEWPPNKPIGADNSFMIMLVVGGCAPMQSNHSVIFKIVEQLVIGLQFLYLLVSNPCIFFKLV